MDAAENLYNTLIKIHPDKVETCTRKGSFTTLFALLGVPCDPTTAGEVLRHAKKKEAEKLTAPYLLSDYLCYVYDGTLSQLAREHDTTTEQLEAGMYDGCYWHDGMLLRPIPLGKPKEVYGVDLSDFLMNCVGFGGGNAHTLQLYSAYVLLTQGKGATRVLFCSALGEELAARGVKWSKAVRVGDKVSTGYKGISVKTI